MVILLVRPAQPASAHPADMYAQNQSLTFAPDGLHVNWKIAPGPVLAGAVSGAVARDPNAGVSAGRFDAYWMDIQTGASRLLVTGGDLPAFLP